MKNLRYFIYLYIEDDKLQSLLDLAIFILNPLEKWPAHITVAGPYENRRTIPTDLELGKKVTAFGAGQFRSDTQNTVYLSVIADLEKHWDKPDYGYTPHLTLYDGDDSILASRFYERLFETRVYITFHVSRLHVIEAIRGQASLALFSNLKTEWMPDLKGKDLLYFKSMPREERIERAIFLLRKSKAQSLHSAPLINNK